jgi:hypothetical protein
MPTINRGLPAGRRGRFIAPIADLSAPGFSLLNLSNPIIGPRGITTSICQSPSSCPTWMKLRPWSAEPLSRVTSRDHVLDQSALYNMVALGGGLTPRRLNFTPITLYINSTGRSVRQQQNNIHKQKDRSARKYSQYPSEQRGQRAQIRQQSAWL